MAQQLSHDWYWPRWSKLVERWFRQPDDIGVGDSFEHMAEAFGADRVAKFVERWGIDCGCGDRKVKWNRLYPYQSKEPTL